jgi:hypothetical protein
MPARIGLFVALIGRTVDLRIDTDRYSVVVAIRSLRPTILARNLGPMRLWVDDLAEITDLIADVAPIFHIRTDKYQVTSVDELTGVKEKTIRRFVVAAGGDRIQLEFSPYGAAVAVRDPDLKARGLVTEIEKIAKRTKRGFLPLRTRKQRLAYLYAYIAFWTLPGFWIIPQAVRGGLPAVPKDWITQAALGVLGSAAIAYFTMPRIGAVMYTRTRAQMPTWWTRNRDGITTNVIVSAAFLVIGIVIGYLLPGK